MTSHHFRYLFSAIVILTGIILILCGMNFYRALYLIIFGALFIPFEVTVFWYKTNPKGVKTWARKVLNITLGLMAATSMTNFLMPKDTYDFNDMVMWLCAGLICGPLFGTIAYFAHNTGEDEAEFEAKKKKQRETEDLYDRLMEEKDSPSSQSGL